MGVFDIIANWFSLKLFGGSATMDRTTTDIAKRHIDIIRMMDFDYEEGYADYNTEKIYIEYYIDYEYGYHHINFKHSDEITAKAEELKNYLYDMIFNNVRDVTNAIAAVRRDDCIELHFNSRFCREEYLENQRKIIYDNYLSNNKELANCELFKWYKVRQLEGESDNHRSKDIIEVPVSIGSRTHTISYHIFS